MLPDELGDLSKLEFLGLNGSPISKLHWTLHKSTNLKIITVRDVPLKFPFNQYAANNYISGDKLTQLKQFLSDLSLGIEEISSIETCNC